MQFGYNLVCVDGKFRKPFEVIFRYKKAVFYFANSITEESKYYIDVMKKYFTKKLLITKNDSKWTLGNVGFLAIFMLKAIFK